jgi:TorA maturation chaperone TorD
VTSPPIAPLAPAHHRRPVLVVNPATDWRLVDLAVELTSDERCTPAALQTALRAEYPDLVVHRRELSGEPYESWYVYRDGHWIAETAFLAQS